MGTPGATMSKGSWVSLALPAPAEVKCAWLLVPLRTVLGTDGDGLSKRHPAHRGGFPVAG